MPDPISWSFALPYLAIALAFGYLVGSIPFGVILTRLAGLGDIRAIGSGNIGATNVLRTGRKDLAALTLLADILKGTAAVWLAGLYGPDPQLVAGFGALTGHIFPVWLKFRGGKGVATYLGVLIGFYWPAALAFAAIWLYCAAFARLSSFAGLTASLAVPFILFAADEKQVSELFIALTLLVWLRHYANIRRLVTGTEPRLGESGHEDG
ncbi:MAG: glycerol-3-phosphate 1-O-acyltransferase PlsY [Hyphomicrobiales bacterium]|nr:glycerol-3-phosphate 1-O-acyltransferase PlsY [Hyphomicrobiales bacterium]